MTIEGAQDPWPWPDYPDGMAPPGQYWNPKWSRRVLLRPHGSGRLKRTNRFDQHSRESWWYGESTYSGAIESTKYFPTRAQAAQAVYRE